MSEKAFTRWAARITVVVASVLGAVSAYPQHNDILKFVGGLLIPWIFVWLGGEIERNREHKP